MYRLHMEKTILHICLQGIYVVSSLTLNLAKVGLENRASCIASAIITIIQLL